LLQLTGESISSETHHPLPKIIFSQIPDSHAVTEPEIIKIEKAGQIFGLKREEMLFTMHEQNLMVPKPYWDEMMKLLERSLLFF